MYGFLSKVGSLTLSDAESEITEITAGFQRSKEKWTDILARLIKDIIPKNRELHSQDGSKITVTNKARFLNKTHRDLVDKTQTNPADLCLKVEPERRYIPLERVPLTKNLLLKLIAMVAPLSPKAESILLNKISATLTPTADFTQEQLSFILRDVLATALQRDYSSYSFFSTDREVVLIKVINTNDEFKAIKQLLRLDDKPICYSDLSTYVLGRNDFAHFNYPEEKANLAQIEQHQLGEDSYRSLFH